MQLKFFYCPHCGKIISIVKDSGVETICCGQPMKPLIPGTTDGAKEKHLPVVTTDKQKITVTVGETLHPSLPEHYIEWIVLQTDKGIYQKMLNSGDKPEAEFAILPDEKIIAAYEYCNLHKLWKTEYTVL
ncbi:MULTISPECIES: desulfoferrodoxin family protein [unclassified Treponema]|uniref:desulfoferrodoxin family protein n=2 Tax=Treponema TaxID=157 RepID=UPI0025DA7A18|nr:MULTISPECIES: desulfoferrodoxin family protein [unclassified Treponema]